MTTALRDALTALHPSPEETHLLRACLWSGPGQREAWQAFGAEAGDLRELFRADSGRRKRLGPLVAWAIQRGGLAAEPVLLTVLRTAALREELRAKVYQEVLGAVLRTLGRSDLPFLVIRGAGFGITLYDAPSLRHSHDIDLLLRPEDLDRAASALGGAGFHRSAIPGQGTDRIEVVHRTTLPVNLRSTLFEAAGGGLSWERLWAARRETVLLECPVVVLSSADELLGVLGHASAGANRASLQWACDAWLLIARTPELDWERLVDGAAEAGATLSCWALLSYMVAALEAPVPPEVIDRLAGAAGRVPAIERDHTLFALRTGTGVGGLGLVRRGASLRSRMTLLRWLLLPSAAYLRAAYGIEGTAGLPVVYLRRFVRYGLQVLQGRSRALPRESAHR